MKIRQNLTAGLAIASLLFTNLSHADEVATIVVTEPAGIGTDETNRDRALEANTAAAEQAVQAVLEETRLDLDIRLIGPTSVKIAGDL